MVTDKDGCEYGRETRDKVVEARIVVERNGALFGEQIKSLASEVKDLRGIVNEIRAKLSWLLGVYAGIGSLVGAFIGIFLAKH